MRGRRQVLAGEPVTGAIGGRVEHRPRPVPGEGAVADRLPVRRHKALYAGLARAGASTVLGCVGADQPNIREGNTGRPGDGAPGRLCRRHGAHAIRDDDAAEAQMRLGNHAARRHTIPGASRYPGRPSTFLLMMLRWISFEPP